MSDTIHFESHRVEVENKAEEVLYKVMEEIGLIAERYAKMACTVDTGRLRNSITHAVGGKPAAISTYKGDRPSKYGNRKELPPGTYSGSAPGDKEGVYSVYIGTNVEYAPFVELGAKGREAVHFLQNAVANHIKEYENIIRGELSNTE